MNIEEKNIELAKADGWRLRWQYKGGGELYDEKPNRHCWKVWTPKPEWWNTDAGRAVRASIDDSAKPPNYFNDLNAVHQLEKVLKGGMRSKYDAELGLIASRDHCFIWETTATQRCEAFGKTLNLW